MTQESNSEKPSQHEKRRPPWVSGYEALKYVGSLSRKNFRRSDKITDILAGVSVFFLALLIFIPVDLLKISVALACESVFIVIVIFFIANRLGILSTLSERQAVLVWDIILGTLLFGILLTVNILMIVSLLRTMPPIL